MEDETRSNPDHETLQFANPFNSNSPIDDSSSLLLRDDDDVEEQSWVKTSLKSEKKKKKKNQKVFLEGYVDSDSLSRSKSLTDDDLDELKGCLDLGFGFSYDEIPELCNTLPALELCYSMSQRFFLDDHPPESHSETTSVPIANWKISSPGDHPEDVKARLKYWAQAVACTVRLCS